MSSGHPSDPDAVSAVPIAAVADLQAGPNERATIADRTSKIDVLRREGIDPFQRRFPERTAIAKVREDHAQAEEDRVGLSVRVAGRLLKCRRHRRAVFLDLRDQSGEIECLCLAEELGDELFERTAYTDVGDIVGVEGDLVTTRRGEPALLARDVVMLGKSLTLPPQRAVGQSPPSYARPEAALMVSDELQRILRARADLLAFSRSWLNEQSFLEVETPILLPLASGASARPFVTRGNALDSNLYLRIATEQHLKRWAIGGFERVFEVARCFRNEGMSNRHHFEFTMLEWMEGYADYNDAMRLTEVFISQSAVALTGSAAIRRGETVFDMTPPWRRMTVREAIGETIGVDILDADSSRLAQLLGPDARSQAPWPDLVGAVYSKLVEPKLLEATFITDFPKELFPLARKRDDQPFAAEAFEAIVGGLEVASGLTAINDLGEQRERFAEQRARQEERREEEENGLDEDFLQALSFGMMPGNCVGIGVDRLLMLLTDSRALREVIPFPTLRKPKV